MDLYQGLTLGLLVGIGAEVTYLTIKKAPSIRRKAGISTLVDTSVLIDGRIVAVAKAGFAGGTLIVPRSVIAELQYMADNADHNKRTRARYGLDVIQELQQMKGVTIEVLQDGPTKDVDSQLILLAKQYQAQLCTIDYNLNKVAVVEGITVLNVNELAQALRVTHLPGETYKLQLVQKGSDSHQGVGYLEDGTMVVVEHSNSFIGQDVMVEFTRVLQTQAGRMMFARRIDDQPRSAQHNSPKAVTVAHAKPQKHHKPQNNNTQQNANAGQKPLAPQPPQEAPKPPKQKEPKKEPKVVHNEPQPRADRPQRHRRANPEDSLIELANKQQK